MIDFQTIKGFLLDLDGTLYWKDELIPGVRETLATIRQKGYKVRFITNTDSKTPEMLFNILTTKYQLPVELPEIFNPATALMRFFQQNSPASAFFILTKAVYQLVKTYESQNQPKYVVIGDVQDQENLYTALNQALRFLKNGAKLIGLQESLYYVNKAGINIDTGAFVHLLEQVSNQRAIILGKPNVEFFQLAMEDMQISNPQEVVVVGDALESDILGGNCLHTPTILVQTGKGRDKLPVDKNICPSLTLESIADLLSYL